MLKKVLTVVLGTLAAGLAGLGLTYYITQPIAPAASSPSASWLKPGPYAVAQQRFSFVDSTRPTAANNDFPGSMTRNLPTTLWFPADTTGNHPLIIYSHGFTSNRNGGKYLAEHLASHGYVVASADFPLSHGGAPGGPNVGDVSNQPADVRFLIDSILALSASARAYRGSIDPERIGAMGLSLGGLTTTLATYHPRLRDPRIRAAVSIAGPASMFTARFFATADTPFLMIAGTSDAIVDYQANARNIPTLKPGAVLLSIQNGSHTAFASLAEPYMRLMHNPDSLGCSAVTANLDQRKEPTNPFSDLGDAADGISFRSDLPPLCGANPLPEAVHPGRQHMITRVAVHSFFESVFAQDAAQSEAAWAALTRHLDNDFEEASIAL